MIEGMFSNVNVNKRDKQNGEIIMLTSYSPLNHVNQVINFIASLSYV